MFDIGFWELVLIGIIGLLVVGPERLPGFAREAGRWVRKIRRLTGDARRELRRELQWDEDDSVQRETGRLKQKLSDMDRLMREAPDRQPGHEPEYTPNGARKKPATADKKESPADKDADKQSDNDPLKSSDRNDA